MNTRIYNKVGLAYGTATDVAYVKDRNGIEFFLTATILTNKNEIFNDNQYEYDQLGIPFLAALGRELYQFEKNKNSVKWLWIVTLDFLKRVEFNSKMKLW